MSTDINYLINECFAQINKGSMTAALDVPLNDKTFSKKTKHRICNNFVRQGVICGCEL